MKNGGNVMLGVLRVALLRADFILHFGFTRQAFLSSLAPLIAFPLVGGVLGVLAGDGLDAVAALLGTVVALLAPPVLSEALAGAWGREGDWLRYATAFNWSRWPMLMALFLGMLFAGVLASGGLTPRLALGLGLMAVAVYGVVLDWFVARIGLRLVWWRAALLVVTVNVGAALLFLLPRLLAGLVEDVPA